MAKGNKRLRAAIVEMAGDLHKAGLMKRSDADKVTLRMLDQERLPKIAPLSGAAIRRVRENANLSQAVFARYLNLTPSYVSQLERGRKRPSGAAAKLLDVIRRKGMDAIL